MRDRLWLILLVLACMPTLSAAQGNFEIQVYGSETVPPKSLMVELHSNYTADGQKEMVDGVYPTNHQLHETLELTQGKRTVLKDFTRDKEIKERKSAVEKARSEEQVKQAAWELEQARERDMEIQHRLDWGLSPS